MSLARAQATSPSDIEPPDVSGIVTEDDTPVDNFASEKQQRLLTEPLYSSWSGPPPSSDPELADQPRRFIASSNVGLFASPKEPPIVPDAFLSLDVEIAEDIWKKENRTYFFWEMGKSPDVVIEVVSNREGAELTSKKNRYARMRIPYYVVWDPQGVYGEPRFRAFQLMGNFYVSMERAAFPDLGLSLVFWEGSYEGFDYNWLRWATLDGALIPTGAESADAAQQRADAAQQRADAAQQRADRLAAKLRALGIDPNGDG